MTYGEVLGGLRRQLGHLITEHPRVSFDVADRRLIGFYRNTVLRFTRDLARAATPGTDEPDTMLEWAGQEGRVATHFTTALTDLRPSDQEAVAPWSSQSDPTIAAWREAAIYALRGAEQEMSTLEFPAWTTDRRMAALADAAELTYGLTILDRRYAGQHGWRTLEDESPELGQIAREASIWARTGPLDYRIDQLGYLPPSSPHAGSVERAVYELDSAVAALSRTRLHAKALGSITEAQVRLNAHLARLTSPETAPELRQRLVERARAHRQLGRLTDSLVDLDGTGSAALGHVTVAAQLLAGADDVTVGDVARLDRALSDLSATSTGTVTDACRRGSYLFPSHTVLRRVHGPIARPVTQYARLSDLDRFRSTDAVRASEVTAALESLHALSTVEPVGVDPDREDFLNVVEDRPAWQHTTGEAPRWKAMADVIEARIASGQYVDFVPPSHHLESEFKVSGETLPLALNDLRRRGIIDTGSGRRPRIVVGGKPSSAVDVPLKHTIARDLAAKIANGEIADSLPERTELVVTYATGRHTINGAVNLLREWGMVETVRATFGGMQISVIAREPVVDVPASLPKAEPRWLTLANEIQGLIEAGQFVDILPGRAELRATYRCAGQTIRQAELELAARGVLELRRNRPSVILKPGQARTAPPPPKAKLTYLGVAADLGARVRDGEYKRVLPSTRDISTHYGISLPTVTKVILELEREGLIKPRDRQPALIVDAAEVTPRPAAQQRITKQRTRFSFRPSEHERLFEKLADNLIARVQAGEFTERLPTAQELADEAGVSKPVALRAVMYVEEQGLVLRPPERSKRGALVHPNPNRALDPSEALQRRFDLANVLARRIRVGEWDEGPLPSVADLADQHAQPVNVTNGAFLELERRGLIRRAGRGWVADKSLTHDEFAVQPEMPGQAAPEFAPPSRERAAVVLRDLRREAARGQPLPKVSQLMDRFAINGVTVATIVDRLKASPDFQVSEGGHIMSLATESRPSASGTAELSVTQRDQRELATQVPGALGGPRGPSR